MPADPPVGIPDAEISNQYRQPIFETKEKDNVKSETLGIIESKRNKHDR